MRKYVLALAALAEAGTGLLLLVSPQLVVHLLFAAEVTGAGVLMSRIAGIALIGLGVSCWPSNSTLQPLWGMLTYSTLAMLYLIILGLGGRAGILLWPAVVVHAGLAIVLVWTRSTQRKAHLS